MNESMKEPHSWKDPPTTHTDFCVCVCVSEQFSSSVGNRDLSSGRRCNTHHSLEAGVELREKRRLVSLGQDPLLYHRTFDIIILDDHVLLQDLDGVQLL